MEKFNFRKTVLLSTTACGLLLALATTGHTTGLEVMVGKKVLGTVAPSAAEAVPSSPTDALKSVAPKKATTTVPAAAAPGSPLGGIQDFVPQEQMDKLKKEGVDPKQLESITQGEQPKLEELVPGKEADKIKGKVPPGVQEMFPFGKQ